MKILAFDTVMNVCNAACFDSSTNSLFSKSIELERGHAEVLVPTIEEVMSQAGWSYQDVDLIGVTRGPGAFTGLRIGLSTARAYGLSLDKPVVGISTFEIMHQTYIKNNKVEDQLCILLETKRDDYYMALYSKEGEIITMGVRSGGDILNMISQDNAIVVTGNAVERFLVEYKDNMSKICKVCSVNQMIDVADFVQYCIREYEMGSSSNVILPLYLRDADISFPKKKPRKLKDL